MHPGDTRARAPGFDGMPECLEIAEMRKVDPGAAAETAPGPKAGVDVEQLEATLARIVLELDFGHAAISKRTHEAARGILDLFVHDCFDKRAGAAKVDRMLAAAARRHQGEWLAALPQACARELR